MKKSHAFLWFLIVLFLLALAFPMSYSSEQENSVGFSKADIVKDGLKNREIEIGGKKIKVYGYNDKINNIISSKQKTATKNNGIESLDTNKNIEGKEINESEDKFRVILGFKNRNDIEEAIREGEFNDANVIDLANVISIETDYENLGNILGEIENVQYIELEAAFSAMLSQSNEIIRANQTRNLTYNGISLNGSGQSVCVIDSGVNYSHSALGGGWGNKVIAGYDFVNDDSDPADDFDHGTHVAGIIASNDETYKGIAPGANIVAIKVLDSSGSGTTGDIASGMEWCINNSAQYNISVISMSLGTKSVWYSSDCDATWPTLTAMANLAVSKNISVIAASGNENRIGEIASPACIANITAVGATDKSDNYATYSNIADTVDMLAPGTSITSTKNGTGFISKSGTSMATPHVSAVYAIMAQYLKLNGLNCNVSNMTQTLIDNPGASISYSIYTIPRIDAYSAILALDDYAPILTIEQQNNTAVAERNKTFNLSSDEKLSSVEIKLKQDGSERWATMSSTDDLSWNITIEFNTTANSTYSVIFNATDLINNQNISNYTYYSNNLTATAAENYYYNSTSFTLNYSAASNFDNVLNYTFYINNSLNKTGYCDVSDNYCELNHTLATKEYNSSIYTYDNYGFGINRSVNITVNAEPPYFRSVSINNTNTTNETRIYITANVSDYNGIDSVSIGGYSNTSVENASLDFSNSSFQKINDTLFTLNCTLSGEYSGWYNLSVTASDNYGNNNTNNSIRLYLDLSSPEIQWLGFSNVSNENGNMNISFSVDEYSFREGNLSFEDISHNITSNGTHEFNESFRTGNYSLRIFMIDDFGHYSSSTKEFSVFRKENFSFISGEIKINHSFSNCYFDYTNGTEINESEYPNKSMNILIQSSEIIINISNVNGSEINFNKSKSFSFINSTSSGRAATIEDNIYSEVKSIIFFENMSRFIQEDNLDYTSMVLNFSTDEFADYEFYYISDDRGSEFYKMNACSSAPPTLSSENDSCYSYDNENFTGYLKHLSGIAALNDTISPNITIYNQSLYNSSTFTLNISVKDKNPNQTFCWYYINQTHVINQTLMAVNFTNSSNNFTYTSSIYNFTNGTYNLTVHCIDQRNQSASEETNFTVADNAVPQLSVSTSVTSTSASFNFSSDESFNYTLNFSGDIYNSSRYIITHNITIASLTSGTDYSYNITGCDVNNNCNETEGNVTTATTTTTTTTGSGATTTLGGGGGGGGGGSISSNKKVIKWTGPRTEGSVEFENLNINIFFDEETTGPKLTIIKKSGEPSIPENNFSLHSYYTITPEINTGYKVEFGFTVEKSWISENRIYQVMLYQYHEGNWTKYIPALILSKNRNNSYLVELNSFSSFAIIGRAEYSNSTTTTISTSTSIDQTSTTIRTNNENQSSNGFSYSELNNQSSEEYKSDYSKTEDSLKNQILYADMFLIIAISGILAFFISAEIIISIKMGDKKREKEKKEHLYHHMHHQQQNTNNRNK